MPCEYCQLKLRFPNIAQVATYLPGATFGPRKMRDWEFVWMVEGDATYQWENAVVDAPEGSVVLCRPGGTDSFVWDKHKRTRHAFFHFDILSIPGTWPAVSGWPFVRVPHEGDVLRHTFKYLMTPRREQSPAFRLSVMQMLAAFVFGEFESGDVPPEALPRPVDAAMRYLHRALDEDAAAEIHLLDLAEVAAVSAEHLCRLFRKSTGLSPAAAIRIARLDRAMVLLARSNYSIGEIATMCGFASQFHFSRTFREVFGRSPREMRRGIAAGETPPTTALLRKWGV